jgi:hypothetical protein
MKLNRLQLKVLRVWLRYHASGYGIGQWLRTCWKSWLVLAVMAAWSYYFVVPVYSGVGWTFFGLCLGGFLRDIGYYQVSRRTWPVTDKLIDWERAQELVSAREKSSP